MVRKIWLALGWSWITAVFYLSLMPHPPEPVTLEGADKLEHLLAYAMLMLWFSQLYAGAQARLRLFLSLAAMGIAIEVLQGMSGYRSFEYADMLANATGALAGWGLAKTPVGRLLAILEKHAEH